MATHQGAGKIVFLIKAQRQIPVIICRCAEFYARNELMQNITAIYHQSLSGHHIAVR
jgi:hypothetical protein